MKKLLLFILCLASLTGRAQWVPATLRIYAASPGSSSQDSIRYDYTPGKIGGFSYLVNAQYIRAHYAPITGGGYVPNSRQIINGYAILGGHSLLTDVTLSADTGLLVNKIFFNSVIGTEAVTRLATKLNLSGSNANQNIIINGYSYTSKFDNIQTTYTDGIVLTNSTPGNISVTDQYSPSLRFHASKYTGVVNYSDIRTGASWVGNGAVYNIDGYKGTSTTPTYTNWFSLDVGTGVLTLPGSLHTNNISSYVGGQVKINDWLQLNSLASSAGQNAFDIRQTNIISSGTVDVLTSTNTYNQTGTAGSVDFKINRVETGLGSGTHFFSKYQVAGVDKFTVDRLGNVYNAGSLGIGTPVNSTFPIDLISPAGTGVREYLFRGKVSDAGNDAFFMGNSTIGDNVFAPSFMGYHETSTTRASLQFIGALPAANDVDASNIGAIDFEVVNTTSATDPLNTIITTPLVNKRIFTIRNGTTNMLATMFATGDFAIGTTTNSTARMTLEKSTGNQLQLNYSTAVNAAFTVNSSGKLTISPTGGNLELYTNGFSSGTGLILSQGNGSGNTASGRLYFANIGDYTTNSFVMTKSGNNLLTSYNSNAGVGGGVVGTSLNSANGFFGINTSSATSLLTVQGGDAEINTTGSNGYIVSTYLSGTGAGQNVFRHARGTQASPTALLSGDGMGSLSFRGNNGGGFTGSKALIQAYTTQDWNSTNNGTGMNFSITPNNSTTLTTVLTINQDLSVTAAGALNVTGVTNHTGITNVNNQLIGAVNLGGVSLAGFYNSNSFGKYMIGSNRSFGSGETNFITAKGTGGAATGGFSFIDVDLAGVEKTELYINGLTGAATFIDAVLTGNGGGLTLNNTGNTFYSKITPGTLLANRFITTPDMSGVMVLGNRVTLITSGNGVSTTISIPHFIAGVTSTSSVTATARSVAAGGYSYVTIDATNVNFIYTTAPVSGSNNLTYNVIIQP